MAALAGLLAGGFGADALGSYIRGQIQLNNAESLLQYKQGQMMNAGVPPMLAAMQAAGGGDSQITSQITGGTLSNMSSAIMLGGSLTQGKVPWLQGGQIGTPVSVTANYGGIRATASSVISSGNTPPSANGTYSSVAPPPPSTSGNTYFNNPSNTTNVAGNSVAFVPSSQGTAAAESASLVTGNVEPSMTNSQFQNANPYNSAMTSWGSEVDIRNPGGLDTSGVGSSDSSAVTDVFSSDDAVAASGSGLVSAIG